MKPKITFHGKTNSPNHASRKKYRIPSCQALAQKQRKPREDASIEASQPREESRLAGAGNRFAGLDYGEKKQWSCHPAILSAAESP